MSIFVPKASKAKEMSEVVRFHEIQYIHRVKCLAPSQRNAGNVIKAFDYFEEAAYEETKHLIETGANHIVLTGLYSTLEKRATLMGALRARKDMKVPYFKCPIICHITNLDRPRSKHIHLDMDPVETTLLENKIQTLIVTLDALGADGFIFTSSSASQIRNIKDIASQVTNKHVAFMTRSTNMVLEGESFVAFEPKVLGNNPSPEEIESFIQNLQEHASGEQFVIFTLKEFNQGLWDHKNALAPVMAATHPNLLIPLGHSEAPVMIGERINPIHFNEVLKNEDNGKIGLRTITHLLREAASQRNAGSLILNLNLGWLENLDNEEEMKGVFCTLLYHVSTNVDAGICVDCSNPNILEPLLKIFPGRLIINSVTALPNKTKPLLKLAKKYGSIIICMPIDSSGVPQTFSERASIVKEIVLQAFEEGLTIRDIMLDPIVLPLIGNEDGPETTFKTLRLFKDTFDCPTVIGLSNISSGIFDKEERSHLNKQFLTLCLSNSLSAAILDPFDWDVRDTFNDICDLLGYKKETQDVKIYKLKK